MDLTAEIFLGSIGTLISLATLFAGIGYFRQGKNHSELDAITILKEKVEILEGKIKDQEIKIDELKKVIEDLYKDNLDKSKKITETLNILQGRDPQMQTLMDIMKKYMETNIPLLEEIKTTAMPVIKKMDKWLDQQKF